MTSIHRRLAALEAGAGAGQFLDPIAVHFVDAADPQREIDSAELDGDVLTVANDETGATLTERALRVAAQRQAADGRLRLVFLR